MKTISISKKILIMCTGFSTGGILSCFIQISRLLYESGNEVDILTCGDLQEETKKLFGEGINFYNLPRISKAQKIEAYLRSGAIYNKLKQKILNNSYINTTIIQRTDLVLCKKLPNWKKKYDIAIAAAEFLPTYYVASKCIAKRKLAWIHPRWDLLNADPKLDDCFYSAYNKIVTVSDDCKKAMITAFPRQEGKIIVLENIINSNEIKEKAKCCSEFSWTPGKKRIVTVCRIDNKSKRIDRLIYATEELKKQRTDFQVVIVGDGPDRKAMMHLAKKTGTEQFITFVGRKINPYPYINEADIFILTSQYEGKPIAVTEAMILGKQLLLTDCINWDELIMQQAEIVSNDDEKVANEIAEKISGLIDHPHVFSFSSKVDNSNKVIAEIIN